MTISIFAGAGFSKWAAGLPLANELFDFQIEPWGSRESDKLDRIKNVKESWDNNNPHSLAEEFIGYVLNEETQKNKKLLHWYLGRRLSGPFIYSDTNSRNTLDINDYRLTRMESIWKVYNLIEELAPPLFLGIITTNYDMLFEYALGSGGFHYGKEYEELLGTVRGPYLYYSKHKKTYLSGSIPVSKLHGSISWDERGYYTDARRALTGNALIVAPTHNKRLHPLLERAWILAAQILNETSRLIVFGFAFNEYDQMILQLLRGNGKKLKHILLVDINPNIYGASKLWPETNITTTQPPPEGNNIICEWVKNGLKNFWLD